MSLFLSTLSLRRATSKKTYPPRPTNISIHALLTESDYHISALAGAYLHFYPRSPYGERLCHN